MAAVKRVRAPQKAAPPQLKKLGLRVLAEKNPSPFEGDTEYHDYKVWLTDSEGKAKGQVEAFARCPADQWARVDSGWIDKEYQGKALYPEMLKALRDELQRDGCLGVVSRQTGRHGQQSTASWQKFADKEPRVRKDGGDYYLSALPKTGRIPMPTVNRALKSLGRKAASCGITPAALRLGMEVEREHRDVTKGGVLKTAKIAAAHLCESPRYYTELKKLERKLKRKS
jgi:hypothetical protein